MSALMTVAGKLVTLFIYVILGYIACKKEIVSRNFCEGISSFVMTITLPCLVLSTFQADYTVERLMQAGQVYGISLIIFGASILLGHLSARVFKIAPEARGVWVYAVTFPNHAFMGWPVMSAVFGEEAVFFATFANLAFSTYAYTYGIWLMEHEGGHALTGTEKADCGGHALTGTEKADCGGHALTGTEKADCGGHVPTEGKKHSVREYILTPVNAAIVAGMILFVTQWRLPGPIDNAVGGLSALTTPLAMFYVGTILTKSSVREVLGDWRVYACSLMRLIVIPALVLVIARPFVHDPLIYGVLVIGHAMPVAGFCAIFAGEYHNDVVLASKFIFITTLLCIITIPVFTLLL